MPELNALRAELAEIDQEIMELVGRRNRIAEGIGAEKAKAGAAVVVPSVERIVEDRYIRAGAACGVSAETARRIARAVIDESVDIQGRLPRAQKPLKICIAGGNGGMGRWLSAFFAARGHRVSISDPEPEGAVFPVVSLEEGCRDADAVIISVPVKAADAVLADVLLFAPQALVFDILSVKAPVRARLEAAATVGVRVTSVHPMFGPHAPSVAGRNVIVCDCGSDEAAETAAELFSGADILRMPIADHDAAAAYVLGLSHAVNLAFSDALVHSGFSSAELRAAASTTFRKQVAVSREVSEENAELYYAIQRENPENDAALAGLEESVCRVRQMGREEFIRAMKTEAAWYL